MNRKRYTIEEILYYLEGWRALHQDEKGEMSYDSEENQMLQRAISSIYDEEDGIEAYLEERRKRDKQQGEIR